MKENQQPPNLVSRNTAKQNDVSDSIGLDVATVFSNEIMRYVYRDVETVRAACCLVVRSMLNAFMSKSAL